MTHEERQRLHRRLARRPRLSLRSPKLWITVVGISGVLLVLTVLASKLVFWPTVAWGSFAIVMSLWIGLDAERKDRAERRRIENGLATDRVEEICVTATEAVALDEIEDLGEAWALQVEPDLIMLFGPRQDIPRRFPTTDFSYVELRDSGGSPVDFWFKLRGEQLAPVRRVPPEAQRSFDLSRETVPGRLDRLEELLRSGGPHDDAAVHAPVAGPQGCRDPAPRPAPKDDRDDAPANISRIKTAASNATPAPSGVKSVGDGLETGLRPEPESNPSV